jgi:hypothetical protein
MTSQSPRIYIYKITFEEVLYYYYGVHKEKKFGEYYMGSPKTHKWCWELYSPKKQILQLFDFTDEGWLEANQIEQRLIGPVYQSDKWCLNENCGGVASLELKRKVGKKMGDIYGKKSKELGIGFFSLSPEQKSAAGRKGGTKAVETNKKNKTGLYALTQEQRSENGKKGGKRGGKKTKELKVGIFGLSKEEKVEIGKKIKELGLGAHSRSKEKMSQDGKLGGKIAKENKLGFFSLPKEEKRKNSIKGGKSGGKSVCSQKWKCTETGFIANPGNLTRYQRKRGIDTSNRIRME